MSDNNTITTTTATAVAAGTSQKQLRGLASRAWGLEGHNSTKKPAWKGYAAGDKNGSDKMNKVNSDLKTKAHAMTTDESQQSVQQVQQTQQTQQHIFQQYYHRGPLLRLPPGLPIPPIPAGLPEIPGYTHVWRLEPPIPSPSNSSRSSGSEPEVKQTSKDGKA